MKRTPTGSRKDRAQNALNPPRLELTIHASTGNQYIPFLKKYLLGAHRLLHPALSDLSVVLVGDARMSKLHQDFMGIAGPTDVLTFPLDFNDQGREISGEVIVCVPEAVRQGKRRGIRPDHELLLYALHGLLHLCGFDDRTDAAFRRMHTQEDDILMRLGLGPVFGVIESADARVKAREGISRPATSLNKQIIRLRSRRRRAPAAETVGVD